MDIREFINYALGVVGIALTIYYFYKSKEGKEPVFFFLTFKDIDKLNEENSKIKVFYDQDEVQKVFTTYLWIWNRGKKPINKSDIPDQAPINIKIKNKDEDTKILDWKKLKTSREPINFDLRRLNDTTVSLNFDFLDHNDGAAIEIQHTGDLNSNIFIDGVILGCPEGIKRVKSRIEFILLGMKINFSDYKNEIRNFTQPNPIKKVLVAVLLLTILAFGIMLAFGIRSSYLLANNSTNLIFTSDVFLFSIISAFLGVFIALIPNIKTLFEIFIDYPFPNTLYLDNKK